MYKRKKIGTTEVYEYHFQEGELFQYQKRRAVISLKVHHEDVFFLERGYVMEQISLQQKDGYLELEFKVHQREWAKDEKNVYVVHFPKSILQRSIRYVYNKTKRDRRYL